MTTAEKEEDYSDYIKHLSNMGSMYAFLSGFMFTAITIVLTRLPDPTVLMAQCVLLFMGTMLSVFIFYMGNFFMAVVPLCKSRPSYSGQKSIFNIFSDISILLGLSGSVVLLFLLWNLVYLALAQLIVWVFFAILTYRSLFKPFYRRRSGS
jgi:hypothetical protein